MEKKSQRPYLTDYNLLIVNPVNNISKGIHKTKSKYRYDVKKCETCRIKYKYCDLFLECKNLFNKMPMF